MKQIKEHFYFLLLGGINIPEEHLLLMFAELSSLSNLSDENDFVDVGINFTTIFAQKGLEFFLKEEYDEFIEYYKQCLLKDENYELIKYLQL